MTVGTQGIIEKLVRRVAPGIRFPRLFAFFLILLVADILIPDPVPFLDEAVLAVGTILFGMWREGKHDTPPPQKPPEKNVTPRS
ncbi:MAG TPA: DUF6116 family protein [Thermoanaerobaculia bacterium]|nr:DUF6116 family protein [Thermoanaerobaculia bacterium]